MSAGARWAFKIMFLHIMFALRHCFIFCLLCSAISVGTDFLAWSSVLSTFSLKKYRGYEILFLVDLGTRKKIPMDTDVLQVSVLCHFTGILRKHAFIHTDLKLHYTILLCLNIYRHRRVCQWSLSERRYLYRSGQRLPVSVCTWLYRATVSDRLGYRLVEKER